LEKAQLKRKYPGLIWIREKVFLVDPDINAQKTEKIEVFYKVISPNAKKRALLLIENDGNFKLDIGG
jgi:hypothetical protein